MHKHFRMISIHADMRSHGFATEDAPHTRIPGIWAKLHDLFDLDVLDERENAYLFGEEADPADAEEAGAIPEFGLPEDEFGEMMWHKRFRDDEEEEESASSPPEFPIDEEKALYTPGVGLLKDLPASERSQKTETPAEASPTPKNAKNTRTSRAAAKTKKGAKPAAMSAKNNKARSTVSESEEEDDEEEEEQEDESSEEENSAPTTRRGNRGRAKPAPRGKRRR